MCQELPGTDRGELSLRRGDGAPAVDHHALSSHATRVQRDRPHEVDLRLERRVTLAHRERGVDGDAHARVEKGHRVTAVDHPDRVVQVLPRLALEHGPAFVKGNTREPHRLRDGWRRQPAGGQLPQQLEPGPPGGGPHDLERVFPRDRARALLLRFHPQPEKAETTAKIPSTAIARPLNVLIPRTTPGVRRARSSDAATTRMPHHAAEPSSTPATTEAGRISDPPVPKPSVAARAAKDTMVVGLVMVNPSVDA